jgi:hypothetical protein
MRRRGKTGGKAPKTGRPRTVKHHDAPMTARRRKPSAADANEKIALLERKLKHESDYCSRAKETFRYLIYANASGLG